MEARDEWAKTTSANEDVNIYIGALAGNDSAGYVNADTLAGYIRQCNPSKGERKPRRKQWEAPKVGALAT